MKTGRNLNIQNSVITKVICIISFILITCALFIAKNSPAVEYESSIYRSTPIFVWISLILAIIVGITIIIYELYNKNIEKNNLWFIGLLLVYFSYIICQSLFIIRGYYMWCISGDPATHIGFVKEILEYGNIPKSLFYPILHIYTAQINLITNINILSLHKLVPLLFGALYVPFMYLFAKSTLSTKSQILLVAVASSTFVNDWYLNFTPNGAANCFLPLAMYIILKSLKYKDMRWEILTVIMLFLYPVFHPIPTIFLIIFVMSLSLPLRIYQYSNKYNVNNKKFSYPPFKLFLLLILIVWAISWISSFYVWNGFIVNIHTLLIEGGDTKYTKLIDQVNEANQYGYNVIEHVLKTMGSVFSYILLSFMSLPIILRKLSAYQKERYNDANNLFSLYGPLFLVMLFILIFYTLNLSFGPLRLVMYIVIICTMFVGFILDYTLEKTRNMSGVYISKLINIGVIILLVGFFTSGLLTLYPSPYTKSVSYQTTETEFKGVSWLFNYSNINMQITGIYINPSRYSYLLLTTEERATRKIPFKIPENLKVPFHFEYNNNSSLSAYYKKDVYFEIMEKEKITYLETLPEIADFRWTSDDFKKIEIDKDIDKIYSNSQFNAYYINSIQME